MKKFILLIAAAIAVLMCSCNGPLKDELKDEYSTNTKNISMYNRFQLVHSQPLVGRYGESEGYILVFEDTETGVKYISHHCMKGTGLTKLEE